MSALYAKWKEALIQGTANSFLNGTVNIALLQITGAGGYTFSAAHTFYSSANASVIGTPIALSGKTFTDGVFGATPSNTFVAVPGGNPVGALLYYVDTGTPATSRLVFYDDNVGGLPLLPNGGNVNLELDVSGIFAL